MQFNPVITEHLDEIEGAWPMRMPGNLNFLSRAQGTKNLITTACCKRFQLQQLLADVDL